MTDDSYAKQTWLNGQVGGTPLDAPRLQHIEEGLATAVTPGDLAPVATTGAYSDLVGAPALAAIATSGQWVDLAGRPNLAIVASSGSYLDLANLPTIPAPYSDAQAITAVTGALVSGVGISIVPTPGTNQVVISATGVTNYDGLPPGVTLTVLKAGAIWPQRPTTRQDLFVRFKGPAPGPAIIAAPYIGTAGAYDGIDDWDVTQ